MLPGAGQFGRTVHHTTRLMLGAGRSEITPLLDGEAPDRISSSGT